MTDEQKPTKPKRKTRRVLTKQHVGGPAAHKEAVKRGRDHERIVARQQRSWRLFVDEGLTVNQVATRTGVSGKTAWYDIVAAREMLERNEAHVSVVLRERQAAEIDAIKRTHMKRRDEPTSAAIVLNAHAREARLWGLDARGQGTYTVDQIVGLMRGITSLFMDVVSDDAMRRQFALGVRRRMGAIAGEVLGAIPTTATVVTEEKPEAKKEDEDDDRDPE